MRCIIDLHRAGSETQSNTIKYALQFLALNPNVQKKIHHELDKQLSKDEAPSYHDKDKSVYIYFFKK